MSEERVLDKNKPLKPFKFQAKLINETVNQAIKSDKRATFTVSPPGSGKTLMMSEVAKLFTNGETKRNCLFIVHRTEIVEQAKATFKRQGIDMNHMKFGMIQTLKNRIPQLKEFNPQVILVDEAHHAAANSYLKVLGAFPKAIKFFFTATPWRGDGKGFESLANNDDLVLGPSVNWLIEHNYLAPFDYYVKTLYDKKALKLGLGDYTSKSIEEQAKTIDINQIIDTYESMGNNEPAIVYAGSIEQSKNIVNAFNKRGIKAAHLDGGSKASVRENTLNDFKEGKIKVISNVQIFTEGVDLPDASVALIARPTMSIALYYQFSMRVLRYKKGKRAKIIDFAGVANDLGLPNADREWSLLRRDVKNKFDTTKEQILFECPRCHKVFSAKEVIKQVTVDDKNICHVKITCPDCNTLIDERSAAPKTPEMVELQQIIDEKEFSDKWYAHASIARDQSLKMNAKILRVQEPNLTNTDIYIRLLKLYLPDFSRNTPYSVVKAVKGFKNKEIDNMINFLNNTNKIDTKERNQFDSMFKARKSYIIDNYSRKTDLSSIDDDKEFIEIFRNKVQIIKSNDEQFGDKVNKAQILKELTQNLITTLNKRSISGNIYSVRNKYEKLLDKMKLMNLISLKQYNDMLDYGINFYKDQLTQRKKYAKLNYKNKRR